MSFDPSPVRRFGRPAPARLSRAVPACLAVTAALGVLTACSPASSGSAPTAVPSTVSAAAADVPAPGAGQRSPAASRAPAPAKVSIPSLGISAPLMRLGLQADGTVEVPPPDRGMTAGWYTGGPTPGAAGPAVIIGHNSTRYGRAVFHDLRHIAKGADITVTDVLGKATHFSVTRTQSVS
ncbi:sortase domain-bontaining protein [Streptomyces sp. NPDC088747]|uniref:sortase domain-containing protein n=1 Tax=Streptomyces sp. NPDC088747 TaxID=3365886 RepID=UPI0038205872